MKTRKQVPRMARKTLVGDARAVTGDCLATNARLAARRITRYFEARMRACDLSIAQFGLMARIAAARDDTIGALADEMDLDPSTLSRNLRGLERAGLIEIAIVEKDLRKRALWLTETGARRLEAAIPLWRAAQAELSTSVDPGAMRDLAAATAVLSVAA